MTPVVGKYKGYWNFEHYWQSGKVYETIPHEISVEWWKKQEKPKRRYFKSKHLKVLHALFPHIDKPLDYIESRKQIYVVEYYDLIKNNSQTHYWQQQLDTGHNLVVYDFDGLRKSDGTVMCSEMILDFLKEKILDTRYPFGHGYVVATTIANIHPSQYI